MGLYFVNLEKERGWFGRFMEQHEKSDKAEHHEHRPQTRTKKTIKDEPSLHYVEAGEATINIDDEIVAKLGTGRRYTGVLVPPKSTVQWNVGQGARIRVLVGEKEISEVVAPAGGKT